MTLHDPAGGVVELGELLGRGGEGEVYAVAGAPDVVAKVLQPARRTKGKHDKIRAMIERPPTGAYDAPDGLPVLSWPIGLLHASPHGGAGTFVGYTMRRIQPADFVPFYQVTTLRRREKLGGEPVTFDRLVRLGARLCHVVRTLHRFGYAVGDLNDRNVLVSRRFTPLLMDTDSFQVPKRGGHFPSTVGDQLYWAPELLGVDLATYRKSRIEGDRFALATLLFQLFMDGNRPYQARGTRVDGMETLMAKTQAGHFPWDRPVPGELEPPAGAPSFHNLPANLRRGFIQAFVAGHRHPQRRPTADWWYDELLRLTKEGFRTCPDEARHVFGAKQRACPWCADANDPFTTRKTTRKRRSAPKPAPNGTAPPTAAALPASTRAARAASTAPRTQRASVPRKPTASKPEKAVPAPPAPARATPTPGFPPPPATQTRSGADTAPKIVATKRIGRAVKAPAASVAAPPRAVVAAWALALVLVLIAPAVWAWTLPGGLEKSVIAASIVIAAGAIPLAWWAWQSPRDVRMRAGLACLGGLGLAAATAGLGAAGGWFWVELAAGGICAAAAAVLFVRLERHRILPPRPRSILHAAAGLPVAYLPTLVWVAWVGLA